MSAPRPYTCCDCGLEAEQAPKQGRPRKRCPPCAKRHQREQVRVHNAARYAAMKAAYDKQRATA